MLIKLLIGWLQLCLMLYSFSNMTKAVNYTYQSCVTVLFFFFLRKKLNNIIEKDQLNQLEIQKKVVVERPPSTKKFGILIVCLAKLWATEFYFSILVVLTIINSAMWYWHHYFLLFFGTLATSWNIQIYIYIYIYALFNHTSLHCAMLEWIF